MTTQAAAPKVSVIIPLYNHGRYISEAVYSVLGQSFGDFELIIINDGSTDNSEDIVKGITDNRIRYIRQDNCGAPRTINRGISLARGEFVSILNSDDVYDPKRLQECIATLGDPSFSAAFSHLEYIDQKGEHIKYLKGREHVWPPDAPETSFRADNNVLLDLLAGNFLITTSNLFCRKDVFDKVGYFSDLRYAHDYEFFLRLCCHLRVSIIESSLLKYRVHEANTLKEYSPEVSFDVGLALARFLLNHDFKRHINEGDLPYLAMAKFSNSFNSYDADRIILTLLLFGLRMEPSSKSNALLDVLAEDPDNVFRKAGIDRLRKNIESWRHGVQGWQQWREATDRLIAKDKELQDAWNHAKEGWEKWKETNERLIEKNEQLIWTTGELYKKKRDISVLINSRSYRLGRFLTWPARKLRGRG